MAGYQRIYAVLAVFLAFGLGCSNSDKKATNPTGAGAVDGTWVLESKVCNGAPVTLTGMPETSLTISGTTGTIANVYCTIEITVAYADPATVTWTIGPYNCNGQQSPGGDVHTAIYARSGNTLTLTEELTPADEFGCGSGRQVSTFRAR